MLQKRGAVNLYGNRVLENISIGNRKYGPPSYVLLLSDGRARWHQEMVANYTSIGTSLVGNRDGNEIHVQRSIQSGAFKDEDQPPEI